MNLPPNVHIGAESIIAGEESFKRFRSRRADALVLGDHCAMENVHFAIGEQGRVVIGSHCCFTSAVLLCESELRFGDCVVLGFNVTIADSDFHPIAPAQRMADAVACSPVGRGLPRPPVTCQPVIIEGNVWIGHNATVLKGVRIGAGALIEPGAVIHRDVPTGARMLGNPAQRIA